ncbi:MAG TPA: beta-ketoacyl-[acyl-carrier-protein] synthase family protein [Jatrophihabitans sp.]|jgi:3-oxoacyl-[acyl-carrier-protein] synthase II|uniref:beta-ketoacyl synthase N-terminal-like domain-containing protein n=1 Tax=Jatrophihabitans sp. TaxID=1932789 RepID=UPI002EFDCAEF
MSWSITGAGMLSSLGGDVASSYAALCRGETGVAPLRSFEAAKFRVRHAYEVADRVGGRDRPRRASDWLQDVVEQALEQAGLRLGADTRRIPVVVGTGLAEQRSLELWWRGEAPLTVDQLDLSVGLADLGPTYTFVNACSASLYALAVATDLLALGEADAVVVAGTDAITESMFGLLDRVNMTPPTEVRPFDTERRGVILGEGAAAIVLETPEHACSRGASVLAELTGVGTSCDADHLTAPLLGGILRAMGEAHRRAAATPGDIDVVFAHGTGTQLNDETEAQALREVFGGLPRRPLVTALKSMTGHTSGASGLMSLVTAVESLADGRVPPTRNHTSAIESISSFPVVTEPTERTGLRRAQVDAFGFGGVNAVAVVERPASDRPAPDRSASDRAALTRPSGVVVSALGLAVPGLAGAADLLSVTQIPPASFTPAGVVGKRGLRYKDRASQLALCAAAATLDEAGLPRSRAERTEGESFGVVVATTNGISETVCRVSETIHDGGAVSAAPMDLPNASGNVASASVAIWFGFEGFNLTVASGPTSGLDAIWLATAAIRAGRARRMLVIGVEPAAEAVDRLVAETARRHGGAAPRVFDGAAALLLEDAGAVAERGGRVLATVGGYERGPDLDTAACGALAGDRPGLWLTPCGGHGGTKTELAELTGADTVGLDDLVGEALAAYGVLQAAAGASWLAGRPGTRALLTSGGCWGGEYAGLTLVSAR